MQEASSSPESGAARGLAYMFGAALLFSAMSVLVKLGGQRALPVEQLVFARVAFTLVLSYVGVRRAGHSLLGVNRPILLLRGVMGLIGLCCFFYALTELPLADATLIQFSSPVWTAAIAAIVLGEGLRRGELFGVLVSLCGVALVSRPGFLFGGGDPLPPLAVAAALVGAVAAAVAYVAVRKLRETDAPIVVVWVFPAVAFPIVLPFALRVWVWPTPEEWLILVGIGVITQAAQVLMTRALHLARAGVVMAVSYVKIVLGFGWGVLLFREALVSSSVIGAALVFAGLGITTWPSLRARRARGRGEARPE